MEVAVGLYITNLVAIDETRESFEVGGYLTARWLDTRLALPQNQTDAPVIAELPARGDLDSRCRGGKFDFA